MIAPCLLLLSCIFWIVSEKYRVILDHDLQHVLIKRSNEQILEIYAQLAWKKKESEILSASRNLHFNHPNICNTLLDVLIVFTDISLYLNRHGFFISKVLSFIFPVTVYISEMNKRDTTFFKYTINLDYIFFQCCICIHSNNKDYT